MLAAICGPNKAFVSISIGLDAEPVVFRFKHTNRNFNKLAFDPSGQWIVESDIARLIFWPVRRPNPYVLSGTVGPLLR
jgi:hypothetical protein